MSRLTYGEWWFLRFRDVAMIDGELTPKVQVQKTPPRRMNRKDAEKYYKKKIERYFRESA